MTETIAAGDVQRRLCAGTEIALLDMREIGEHARGHPLFAASLPPGGSNSKSTASFRGAERLVALLDDGAPDDRAMRAAGRLASLGYGDARVIEGGARGVARRPGSKSSTACTYPARRSARPSRPSARPPP